jgi:RimJ/RimL family protein N-acetyltransferase
MKILETKRLELHTLTLADDAFIYELVNSPGWLQYIGDRNIRSLDEARHYIQNVHLEMYQKLGYGLWKVSIKEDHYPIGLCGLLKRDFLDQPDIGFAILPQYYRQGYTLEAGQAVLQFAREALSISSVCAITAPGNKASQQLLTKMGLKFSEESDLPEVGRCAIFKVP